MNKNENYSDDDVRKVLYLYPSSCFDNNSRNFCSIRTGEGLSVEEIEKIKKIADTVVVHLIGEEDYDFAMINSTIKLARAGIEVVIKSVFEK